MTPAAAVMTVRPTDLDTLAVGKTAPRGVIHTSRGIRHVPLDTLPRLSLIATLYDC